MSRRREPKVYTVLKNYWLEMQAEADLAQSNVLIARARVETARKALDLYERATERVAPKKLGARKIARNMVGKLQPALVAELDAADESM